MFSSQAKDSNGLKNRLIPNRTFKRRHMFIDDEDISCNQRRQITIIWMLFRLKSSCIPPVNTGPHGGQIENLWGNLQQGAADAETKVPSGENTEPKHSPFKAWSRSVYNHTCYAYCQGFFPYLFLPLRSIHLHFFPKPVPSFSCVGCC